MRSSAGAKGIKLHPRAEQFTLDHPAVRELAALANERELPILIHAGRGIPALGIHAVELAAAFPGTRFILAHAGVCDLSWIWRVAADHPNLMFDTAWWMPADLQALFALVPPGQILFASDAPYGHTLMSAVFQLRSAVQVGLSAEQIRSITSEQSLRIAAGEPLVPAGPAVGERDRASHVLLDRVAEYVMLGAIATMRGNEGGPEMLALARMACDVPDGIDDAPVFAAIRSLLDAFDELARRRARQPPPPGLPHPGRKRGPHARRAGAAGLTERRRGLDARLGRVALPDEAQPGEGQQVVDLVDGRARERDDHLGQAAGGDDRRVLAQLLPEPPDDPLDLPGESEGDPAADRLDRRLADQRSRLQELHLGQLGRALVERVERDLRPGRDDPSEVLAEVGDRVVGDGGAEVDDDAGCGRTGRRRRSR